MLIEALIQLFGPKISVLALLLVGFAVEKHYVSRVTVFTNTIALNVHLLSLEQRPWLLVSYANLGIVFGIYGFVAYAINWRTSILYNLPAYLLYSSLPVALVILIGPNGWLPALVIASLVSLVVGHVLDTEFGVDISHWGPRSGQVNRFIETARMKYEDIYGVHEVDLALGEFER
jgi:hypothetical protein